MGSSLYVVKICNTADCCPKSLQYNSAFTLPHPSIVPNKITPKTQETKLKNTCSHIQSTIRAMHLFFRFLEDLTYALSEAEENVMSLSLNEHVMQEE